MGGATGALWLLTSLALAQDAVEVRTNDASASPQVRLSVTSGATTADVWIRRSRMRFDTGAGTEGFLNVSSSAAGAPVAGDLRYGGGSLLFHDGTSWLTVSTTSGSNASVLLQAATPGTAQTGHFQISGTGFAGTFKLPNAGWLAARNAANTADVNVLQLDGGNLPHFGTGSIVLDPGNDVTITATNPAAARTYTIGDAGANASFVLTEGSQTLSNKTLSTGSTWNGDAVATAFGGTGLTSSGAAGNYLRSNGASWTSSAIQASDLPAGSGNYIQNQSAAQQSASYWISGTARIDTTATVGGAHSNIYATMVYVTGGNVHVQGNEDASGQPAGTRTRLRVGNAWGMPGMYAETNSNATNQNLLLGASSGLVTVGPGGATTMNFQVPSGTTSISDGTVGAPALTFVNDTNTGLYRIGADHLGFSTGGVSRMNIDSSGRVNVSTTNLVTYGTRLQATGGVFNGDNVLDVRISSGAGPGGNGIWAAVYGSDAWGVFAEQEDAGVYGILGYHETGIGYAGVYGTDLGNASYWSGYFSGKLRVTDSISIGSSATRFGMQRVSLTAGGVLFSHPSASIGLSWDSLTNTLTVTNSTGQFYDLGLQRTNETAGFSSTANDTSGNLSLASGNSNGVHWYATAAAEGVAGPGFTFFGTGWSGNIQGIVIYWY